MFQLKFNDNFDIITRDIPYWKNKEDIPNNIKNFIKDTSNKRVVYENSTNKFYCGECLKELDNNYYCKKCDIKHKRYTHNDIMNQHIDITEIDKIASSKIRNLDTTCNYFVFDIVDKDVFLYHIVEEITYYNPLSLIPYKTSYLYVNISNSYYVEKEGVTNLETNIFSSFSAIDCCSQKLKIKDENFWEREDSQKIIEKALELETSEKNVYLYIDNLEQLKNTIYKYSRIWELKDYLKEKNNFCISEITMNPLYYRSFEYLINYKLYDLALTSSNNFNKGKNFKEIFGIDKKYLPFMSKNNITYEELKILQFYPTTDINLLRFFSGYSWEIEKLKINNIDLGLVKNCIEKNNLSSHYIIEYFDYISMIIDLKLDLKDKEILYPSNLREAHDELYNQIEVINDPIIDKKIKSLSLVLSINKYEDDEYIIYPATSIQDLVEESRQQKNCVRNYCKAISSNESQIYFMRKKSKLEKSFVTIEVKDKQIIQARVKYNELPSKEINEILNKWEQNLIPITNN